MERVHEDIDSIVPKITLITIQVIITIAIFQFLRLVLLHEKVNWEAGGIPFAITLVAAIAAFLLLCKYQKLIKEFSLQKEKLEKVVRAEENRRKLEIKMLETQKLESLGVLAGGIAHDFNNLLMGILGNADLALPLIPPGSRAIQNVEEIIRASQRAADLCRQMLAYSGKGQFLVARYDLSEIVREIAKMLEVSVSKKASLRYSLAVELPAVLADATEMSQVIMNLITNASESLGDECGVISVSTGVIECDRAYLSESYFDDKLSEGRYVYLEVSDNGCGMDKETLSRIFDPFYTTKFMGRGLGLAAVLGIIQGHHGAIKVQSEPGQGTSFTILLPAFDGEPKEPASRTAWGVPPSRGGTILLVDDDPVVREVGTQMVDGLGFRCLTAANGQEGLEVFRKHKAEIDCVILDLTMPEMGGEEVFKELRRLHSDVCVVLSSGYNEEDVTQRFVGQGLAGFVQKPYTSANLRITLNRVLGTN
jgi:signal transduction histidine kinase/CheY-like chemotaxis protein